MKLYDYFRSSCAFRLRIALNLKDLHYTQVPVNLLKGEHKSAEYREVNPQGSVPTLQDSHMTITQSLAALEYLEEQYPQPPLLPHDKVDRARVRALSYLIACDIHPLNNLRVLKYLTGELHVSEDEKTAWYKHWVTEGFRPLEAMLGDEHTVTYCHGNTPTMADICLVPQVFNALRFECSLSAFPTIQQIYNTCMQHPAFEKAAPENQPDAT